MIDSHENVFHQGKEGLKGIQGPPGLPGLMVSDYISFIVFKKSKSFWLVRFGKKSLKLMAAFI